ncbi:hypothetical protein SMKC081_13470 [Serratia marcescens]|uniref:hypothetical protein n=1 Tax=Serratia ureilytica TaxID=300181 RepID=UPI00335005FD|nr:hypothetical protein SMKC081_13470 [Serratia marcescens]
MDANYISYENMIAARDAVSVAQEAAGWAYFTMLLTAVSTTISLITLGIAWRAVDTWKKQEKLKIKMDFKKSLMALKTACYSYPDYLDKVKVVYGQKYVDSCFELTRGDRDAANEARKFNQFNQVFLNCCDSWVATEHLFSKSKISEGWSNVIDMANKFSEGEVTGLELQRSVHELYSENFVFK